ncbi:ABC transporter related protein [Arcobacter nitrofigilis DSM 7299]|uniref:ABC transporter related protein n=1 Tax=Arcobacter nitrofigilis (strain ATCC 33309 / DSM 7299 / CCUG 15893 / LMG 7604 / NCTC 12251 / CI) TaxID=572480 RepID=D5V2M0_ARCNC|nr:ATP-binding cassette domain-containing protein [Arcobacter nitrofigilis]ADG92452.1 ABC transporter related protein [Arcobacter nitrofigilis DSM 7299]
MDTNEFVLQIKELSFGYKKSKLIYNNFSLNLKKSEVKSIVGASGSGKSTLFELITKSLKPLKGQITSSKIASIYQDPYSSFHPTYSILEQINDVVSNIDKDELNSLLEELSLDYDLILNRPHKLSGGQLQRCSILRALLMKPELLLVDEATSALDNIIALDVMKLVLKFLPNYGILLITHDMHLASWCSDEIIKLDTYE